MDTQMNYFQWNLWKSHSDKGAIIHDNFSTTQTNSFGVSGSASDLMFGCAKGVIEVGGNSYLIDSCKGNPNFASDDLQMIIR